MADDNARPPGEERDGDIFAVRAMVTRAQALELVQRGEFDFGDRPHWTEAPDRTGRLDLFVSMAQIDGLRAEGIEVEIGSNQSARARERQVEFTEGDRFDGGRIPPQGIGRKFGGRRPPERGS
jgi:hypothetical protein